MSEERTKLNQVNGYAPAELKFYAMHNSQRVNDGDYWLPEGRATPSDCYPVRVSSLGIHYTQRLAADRDYIEHSDGRTYYGSWEWEAIHSQDVTIYLHNASAARYCHDSAGSDAVRGTIKVCRKAGVTKVIAADHHGMHFLLSDGGQQLGGIVFRDDRMTYPELGWLARQVNIELSENTEPSR